MQPRMGRRREQPAVVLVHAEGRITAIDDAKQRAQVVELVVRLRAEDAARLAVSRKSVALGTEAVGDVVHVLDRQQPAILSVQAEQQPVEHDERIVERCAQRFRRSLLVAEKAPWPPAGPRQRPGCAAARPRQPPERDCRRERGRARRADPRPARRRQRRRARRSTGTPRRARVQQGTQVDLQARALDQVSLRRVQAPQAAVGQHAPSPSRDGDVVDDLRHRILAESALHTPAVERPIEALRIADSHRSAIPIGALACSGGGAIAIVYEQPVVRLAMTSGGRDPRLHRERETEPQQNRLDEALLGLRLVCGHEARALSIPQLGQVMQQRCRVCRRELRPGRQALPQEVISEELAVVVGAERERQLGTRRAGHAASGSEQRLLLDLLHRPLTRPHAWCLAVVRDDELVRIKEGGDCPTERSHTRVRMQTGDRLRELRSSPGLVRRHLDRERDDRTFVGVEISRLDDQRSLDASRHAP